MDSAEGAVHQMQLDLDVAAGPATGGEEGSFGETLMALAALPGLGHRALVALTKALSGHLQAVWSQHPAQVAQVLRTAGLPKAEELVVRLFREADEWRRLGRAAMDRLAAKRISVLSEAARSVREACDNWKRERPSVRFASDG